MILGSENLLLETLWADGTNAHTLWSDFRRSHCSSSNSSDVYSAGDNPFATHRPADNDDCWQDDAGVSTFLSRIDFQTV